MDFDWFFYIAKVHLHYSREEFYRSCPKEIETLWKAHTEFNGWKLKNHSNEYDDDRVYNMDEIPWL